ncbi:MAG: porin family protein [Myxococcales bacterium]|nr:porin family protein [Myxococcales bacterium]
MQTQPALGSIQTTSMRLLAALSLLLSATQAQAQRHIPALQRDVPVTTLPELEDEEGGEESSGESNGADADLQPAPTQDREASDDAEGSEDAVDLAEVHALSGSLLFGYGMNLADDSVFVRVPTTARDFEPFGIGLGITGGYQFGPWVVGGRAQYYFGDSVSYTGGGSAGIFWLMLAMEGAYILHQDRVWQFRLSLDLGLAMQFWSDSDPASTNVDDGSAQDFYLAPGARLTYALTPEFFVGGDATVPVIFNGEGEISALAIMLVAGKYF